ncbi:MAG: hypothetical protein ABIJ56_13005 [Pseudomonadota bacterium]
MTMTSEKKQTPMILGLFVLLVSACGTDEIGLTDTAMDSDAEWAVDTVVDPFVDTGADTAPDYIAETMPDTAPDLAPDLPPDLTPDPVTDPGAFDGVPGEFTQTWSGRSYRMYVPGAYSHATPIPVVVGFHGAGDSGSNFYMVSKAYGWSAAADAGPFILIVPDTKSPYSDFAVWSGDPMNDIDEMGVEMGEIIDLISDVGVHYNVDYGSLYAYGFSDGGLFLGVAGMQYSNDYAGLVIAGYGWGSGYAYTPTRLIPVYMICGTSDPFYSYAEQTQAYLASRGHPLEWVPVSGVAHSFSGLMSYRSPTTIYGWLAGH